MKLTKKHIKAIVTKKDFLGKYEVYLISSSCVVLRSCGAIWTVPNEGFIVVKKAPKIKTGKKVKSGVYLLYDKGDYNGEYN